MLTHFERPLIAFVWRPKDIASSVVETARRTGTRIVFDICDVDMESAGMALLQADASGDAVDLKVSPGALEDPKFAGVLQELGVDRIWVELHPMLLEDPSRILRKIEELSEICKVVPVLGDVELIRTVLEHHPHIGCIALKGSEASGFVSTETTFTLYAAVREMIRHRSHRPDLAIWGGVATPEAAAAFLATDCKAIVFESVHWLTDLVSFDPDVSKRIENLRPDHTDLVGLNLGVPCRLFNKGNSKAVRELKDFAGSLCGSDITAEQRQSFAARIHSHTIPAAESTFSREELIPLGVEAAFARSFVRRFGFETEHAIAGFVDELESCLADSNNRVAAFVNSAAARRMGTTYPFIQGAMSWITDSPEFARRVADAGGLPTIALGLMDGDTLKEKLGRLPEVMGERPYAVNVITLAENPHRSTQLAWIRETRPRFAVIAAGEPSHAAELMEHGIEAMYIAPTDELLKMALAAGVQYVICEGHEAGGHVGQHSTLTLAQMVLDKKHSDPELFSGRTIILAGGVCSRETAFMAAMLGADAIQMGTVYLATTDIVESGALTDLYRKMIIDAEPGSTVVTGEGTGLRVRSLKTPKIAAVCSLERDFASGTEDESSFRHKIEGLSAGSLFIAARGLDRPGGSALQESDCIEQGQFMSGACAGTVQSVRTIAELHWELAEAPLEERLPVTDPLRDVQARPAGVEISEVAAWRGGSVERRPASHVPQYERIAITGMSIVNALGNSPEEVWAASVGMKSGIVPVPASKWNHELFYHPRPRMPEKTYCKVGAFQNIEVNRKEIGVPPQDFRTMTDSTKITMWLAGIAVEQSGILHSDIQRERIAVLISQNSGEAAATLQDVIIRGSLTNIVSAVKRVLALTPELEHAVEEEVKAGRIAIDDTTLLGRLNCSAGGFICNRYGFMGPSFSVSAACATALVALYSAIQMIRNGIIDAAVVGGAEEFLTPMHFLEFSALGALAGLSGVDRAANEASRPFDEDRDGMVLGEGGGMIVIERESLARRRGAKPFAYITSMGASNNHMGMVESSRITQEIAIRSSFKDLPYGPDKVHLVECHATSTRQGDVEEVQALKSFFNSNGRTVLTSFKSQIGHTLGASGINSLIRGVMAMNAGVFSPTLNCRKPDPEIGIEGSGFGILTEPADWKLRNGDPRRFEVNAFGFGGSNYVVQLEEAMESQDMVLVSPGQDSVETPSQTVEFPNGVLFFRTEIGGKPHRMSVVAENEQEAMAAVAHTESMVNGGPIPVKRMKALARQGIFVGPEGPAPKLAFVFPGQGSHYAGMGHELYQTFPVIREWMDRAAAVAEFDLLHLLFHDREEDLQKTRWQQPALFTMEYAMVQYLWSLGIRPTALAGHSLGELTALCLAGVYSFEDGFRIVNMRAICMDKACDMNVDPGVMMAVDAPMDVLREMMESRDQVYITNLNSPNQIVIGGNTEQVKTMGAELKEMGFRNKLLRVSMAFHSPIMNCIHDELEEFIAGIEFHAPKIPVVSNTTMKPFPDDTAEIKKIVMAHLESPVHWMHNVRTLWNDFGVRLFVEVGPREVLGNLIMDSIDQADCIQTCLPSAEAMIYRTAIAQLYARGNIPVRQQPRLVSFPKAAKLADAPVPVAAGASRVPVALQSPGSLEGIVQKEINAFVMESFGRFVKPSLLARIRNEFDPLFSQDHLNALLSRMFPGINTGEVLAQNVSADLFTAAPAPDHLQVSVAAPSVQTQAAAQPKSDRCEPETQDVTETVIRIIMEATGYERDEIEPDMDLREDLSIRSSRLPVIMDSVEGHFGIKIELEEFMDVRTIRDIAERISVIVSRDKSKKTAQKSATPAVVPREQPAPEPAEDAPEIKRIVFRESALGSAPIQPVELTPLDSVAVFSASGGTGLRKRVGDVLRRDYGAFAIPLDFMENAPGREEPGFDFRADGGPEMACDRIAGVDSLAGLVFLIDDVLDSRLQNVGDLSRVLKGFFLVLKTFLDSPAKKFVILLHKSEASGGFGRLLAEGLLGMFLSAAQEFSSVQFRSVRLDEASDLRDAIRGALDRSRKTVEIIYHGDQVHSMEGVLSPSEFMESQRLQLGLEDVVVFSGGCSGITPFLARSLVPFGCKLVFLGRTVLDPGIDFRQLIARGGDEREAVEKLLSTAGAPLSAAERNHKISETLKGVEIARTIQNLRASGIDAVYFSSDVNDSRRVDAVFQEIVKRFGKVSGIVHAAGILRDSFIKQMSGEDFSRVVDTKLLGAWNLFKAAKRSELKFFTCLSSVASIQGNPGQSNYSAGNRIMAALMTLLHEQNDSVLFKALMLPPIEGAGMAEDPEIKTLMKRMNAAYIHADELAALFCRELFVAPAKDVWVLFMRTLPDVSTVNLAASYSEPQEEGINTAAVRFDREALPMIDSVHSMGLGKGEIVAGRAFSLHRDLWISDHKPFKFLKHPLVSAIMAVETFMETCRMLYPHLAIRSITNAEFLDILECPTGVERRSEISCRRVQDAGRHVVCEVTLSTREISPSGRVMERMNDNYRALVILGQKNKTIPLEMPGFPVTLEELDSRPMDHAEVLEWYTNRTDLLGRYRVLEKLDGTSPGAVRGFVTYRHSVDFADKNNARYEYSPYLLEALMQVVNFYIAMRDPHQQRSMIPFKIGEMSFSRKCADGERILLEARMRQQNDEGITWDARGVDAEGNVVMLAKDIMMRWFSK
ncbi:MAG TPA: SDR family NAD(P)-dependent oxidoreductase [Desulfomonilaceae bacterium]|nr:SDR family NAD(P)-dependent oxidoreductase [Desulfomonilaceae bacterium]